MATPPRRRSATAREKMVTVVELCVEILKVVPTASGGECVERALQLLEMPDGLEMARNLTRRFREGRIRVRPVSLDEAFSWAVMEKREEKEKREEGKRGKGRKGDIDEFDRIYCETLLERRPEFMQTLEECLEMLKAADRAAKEFFRSLDQEKN